jgi:hypothetical protein
MSTGDSSLANQKRRCSPPLLTLYLKEAGSERQQASRKQLQKQLWAALARRLDDLDAYDIVSSRGACPAARIRHLLREQQLDRSGFDRALKVRERGASA